MPFITLDRAFITALIKRWRPETHTFHLRSGESTVTLRDMEIITSLPIDGRPVTWDSRLDKNKKKELCERLLGLDPLGEVMSGFKVSLKWLRDYFDGKVKEGDDEVMVLRKARGYILQLIGGIVLPDQSSSHVYLCFLSLLDDLRLPSHPLPLPRLQFYYWIERLGGGECSYSCKFGVGSNFLSLPRTCDDEFHSANLSTHVVGYYRFSSDVQRPDEVIVYVTFCYFVTNCWSFRKRLVICGS
ncbi:hypothetical protein RHMOL_Rhmol01G0161700 [Rhododendron molle]|uniref:Uncharacterized protein n=1 Tax=Rhododendron molle TaxID=49168 RepID=A0ACC0Q4Q1_RHOML|nr:hypothetical protein RHMOL_Rhmol01G0161700 [Rhododendron molle]